MSRVVVTGASGFVGRHTLGPLLDQGHEVHAVARARPASDAPAGVTWHAVDLLDVDAGVGLLRRLRPDRLLHLAWTVEHGRFWTDPMNLVWLDASVALARAFVDGGGSHLVVAGTCAEYDWTALGDHTCREDDTPCVPHTRYGLAKHKLHETLRQSGEFRGLQLGWGRLFLLYGPDERPGRLVPSIITALLQGVPANASRGLQVRDWMDARDAGAAFVALLFSDVDGAVNIASGHRTTVAEVVRTLGDVTGRPDLIRLGALPDRPDDPPVLVADTRRLCEEVGFHSVRPLQQGLAEAVAWWRARLAATPTA